MYPRRLELERSHRAKSPRVDVCGDTATGKFQPSVDVRTLTRLISSLTRVFVPKDFLLFAQRILNRIPEDPMDGGNLPSIFRYTRNASSEKKKKRNGDLSEDITQTPRKSPYVA